MINSLSELLYSHIQNTAPDPTRQIAVEIPAMFPVPTLEAVDTIRA